MANLPEENIKKIPEEKNKKSDYYLRDIGGHGNGHSDSDDFESHPDEKWLVSYADMMTLLFGLFVMLYGMAMETQGNPDRLLSDLMSGKNTLVEVENMVKEKEKLLVKLKKELEEVSTKLKIRTQELKESDEEVKKYKAVVLQLQGELQQIQIQQGKNMPTGSAKSMIKDVALLKQSKIANEETIRKLRSQISELKNKEREAEDKNKKLQAEIKQYQLKEEELNAKIKLLNEQLKEFQDLKNKNEDKFAKELKLINENNDLKNKLQELTSKNKQLMAQIQELKDGAGNDNFMIIILKWETDKHDLDLTVTDPLDRSFNFDNRSNPDSEAKFIIDSRSGPGVEMWETPNVESGEYTIDFNFYNNYGNNEPAKVSGAILTRKGEFQVPLTLMDMLKNKKKSFKIQISPAGNVKIKPLN